MLYVILFAVGVGLVGASLLLVGTSNEDTFDETTTEEAVATTVAANTVTNINSNL